MRLPAELDECRGELGSLRAALLRNDREDAKRGALRLERAVRRLRASLDCTTLDQLVAAFDERPR